MQIVIPPKQWIRNPAYDLFFFCALWWVPVSLLVFRSTLVGSTVAFFIIYHIFIRTPHFAATLNFTYLYEPNHQYYRTHWMRYFALPVLILVAYGLRPWFDAQSFYSRVLITVATIWGMQHIAMQNYGVLSLYRTRSAARADTLLPTLEKTIFHELMTLAIFEGVLRLWLPAQTLDPWLMRLAWGLRGLFVLTCVAYGARLWMRRRISPPSIPGILYFLTAISVMIYWPVYNRLGPGTTGSNAYFYVFNGQHCLAYLGLLFHMTSNRELSNRPFATLTHAGYGLAKFYAPLAIGAALMIGFALWRYNWTQGAMPLNVTSGFQAIAVLDGVFVAHYYLESNTWKFSQPHNREVLLPLLKTPTPASIEASA
ncbi:MAG TPA: hypothetical protein VFA60_09110 [Terriglobales bacterium]|nr:hypothetical protein [Terriglobales bacterium]